MSGDLQFQDDVARMLRSLQTKITNLQKATLNDVPAGVMIPATGSVRPNEFSLTREDSVNGEFSNRYGLNEIGTDYVDEWNGLLAKRGFLYADLTASLPKLGQPGGNTNEGSYGVYFPGVNKSRIEFPLCHSSSNDWTTEFIFKTDTLPQTNGCIVYNGTAGTNGWGFMIGATGGGSGSKLLYRKDGTGSQWIDTGITPTKGTWYHAVFTEYGGSLYWDVGAFTLDKEFTYSHGGAVMSAVPTTPTGKTFIGADSAAGTRPFQGYIDELLFHVAIWSGPIGPIGSARDRIHTTMQPAAPNGWLLCDGAEVSAQKYASLYSIIGTREGTPSGSSKFLLPNIVGAVKHIIKV